MGAIAARTRNFVNIAAALAAPAALVRSLRRGRDLSRAAPMGDTI
jgi:hypothetical protein